MNISIVAAQDESGRVAQLYIGPDAEVARAILRNGEAEKSAARAGLKGNVKVEMYRRPAPFKRREFSIPEPAKVKK